MHEAYHAFTQKLVLTSAFGALLSLGLNSLLQNIIGFFAPLTPSWLLPLLEVIAATFGLWHLSKNNKKN